MGKGCKEAIVFLTDYNNHNSQNHSQRLLQHYQKRNLDTEEIRAAAWLADEEGSAATLARAVYGQGLGLPSGWYVEATTPIYYDLKYPYSSGSSRWYGAQDSAESFDTIVIRALMGDNGAFALQTVDAFPASYVLDVVFQTSHKMVTLEVYNSKTARNDTGYTSAVALGGIAGVKAWDWNRLRIPLKYFGDGQEDFDTIKFSDTSGDGSFFLIESLALLTNDGKTGASGIAVETVESGFLADLNSELNWVVTLTDSAPTLPPGVGLEGEGPKATDPVARHLQLYLRNELSLY